MNLKDYQFPEVKDVDLAFPTFDAPPALVKEATERGFYNGSTPYNELFNTLFYSGGPIKLKEDVETDFANRALRYCKVLMGSFQPKHEEKEAVCALILSEIVEI
jgi:hypothetical protein